MLELRSSARPSAWLGIALALAGSCVCYLFRILLLLTIPVFLQIYFLFLFALDSLFFPFQTTQSRIHTYLPHITSPMATSGYEDRWARRLVICCDGTWQSSVSSKENVPSNITKLCRLIARMGTDKDNASKKFHQIVYYDSGIGTGALSSSEAKRQGGTGAGLAENVIEAYNFIVMNYEPGDEIFCFGFSRGAYTARAVAGLVSDIGVIKPIHMQFFPDLYRTYMASKGREFRKTDEWKWFTEGKLSKKGEEWTKQGKRHDPENCTLQELAEWWEVRPHGELAVSPESRTVKVVGVFDTVGSLGIPDMLGFSLAWKRKRFGFHNVKLTERESLAVERGGDGADFIAQILNMRIRLWRLMNVARRLDRRCGIFRKRLWIIRSFVLPS